MLLDDQTRTWSNNTHITQHEKVETSIRSKYAKIAKDETCSISIPSVPTLNTTLLPLSKISSSSFWWSLEGSKGRSPGKKLTKITKQCWVFRSKTIMRHPKRHQQGLLSKESYVYMFRQHSTTLDMYYGMYCVCVCVLAKVGLAQQICHHIFVAGLPLVADPFRNVKICAFRLDFDHPNDPSFSRFS